MDPTSILTALTGMKAAKDAAEAALGVRDFVASGAALAQLTEQLLQAQQSVLGQNIAMASLQADLAAARQELKALKDAANERARYSLVMLSEGVFAYRLKDSEGTEQRLGANIEPIHYLCQRCFDQGRKVVLMRLVMWGTVILRCTLCETDYDTGETVPSPRM